ncbi:uncharacterized protein EDB93DRAFT_1106966 [Suillus bovinus]|uniref:uncharacterized protein n=1 Tax=Suillus bovinus TaxID=48563 RepID=UPI001B85EF62|nr:uncharacterized protein EDB93DRAFT_1106966 [Suillus bovinus]KAG2136096.1 hypothetical protein EDB93DRAFT_1106966 [Suillus bovinus]
MARSGHSTHLSPGRHRACQPQTQKLSQEILAAGKRVMAELSDDELEKAKETTKEWSNNCPPPEIQAQVTSWQNEQGKVLFGMHNNNEALGDGDSFMKTKDWEDIEPVWQEYAQEQFGWDVIASGHHQTKLEEKKAIEPSKLQNWDTTALLSFWYARQEKGEGSTFMFKAWKNKDGDMVALVVSVDTSLTSLKEITAKIMAIITGAQQLPLGHSHFSLTTQADAVWHYGSGPYLPGLVWPNWHSIGYDNTHLLMHPWRSKVLACEELGDHTFDLPVVAGPSVGPILVDLPPSPVIARPSTNPASESWEKGKCKAVLPDPEPEVEGSRKRKSPMILALPFQPPRSTMKTWKQAKTAGLGKYKVFVESEDEEDSVTQPISCGVLEVVLPRLSPDVARTTGSPQSPQSPKKKPFGPTMAIAGKCPEVIEPPQATPEPPIEACHKMEWPCATWFDKRTGALCMSCVYCTTKKIKCISVNLSPGPPGPPGEPDPGPLPKLPPKLRPPHNLPAGCGVNLGSLLSILVHLVPKHQSKTVTAAKEPTPAPAPFPLPDAQGDATSFLLDQPVPLAMSTSASALPPLIDLSMKGMEPNSLNLQDQSAINGLIFELNQIHPEVSQTLGKIVKLDDPGNLFPEYDSVEEMDVQVKGEPSGEDVDMTT